MTGIIASAAEPPQARRAPSSTWAIDVPGGEFRTDSSEQQAKHDYHEQQR
jgi:hypothetical protein